MPTTKVDWALVCDYALIDTAGKLSVLGIFERLFAGNFPALHPVMYLVAQWSGAPCRRYLDVSPDNESRLRAVPHFAVDSAEAS